MIIFFFFALSIGILVHGNHYLSLFYRVHCNVSGLCHNRWEPRWTVLVRRSSSCRSKFWSITFKWHKIEILLFWYKKECHNVILNYHVLGIRLVQQHCLCSWSLLHLSRLEDRASCKRCCTNAPSLNFWSIQKQISNKNSCCYNLIRLVTYSNHQISTVRKSRIDNKKSATVWLFDMSSNNKFHRKWQLSAVKVLSDFNQSWVLLWLIKTQQIKKRTKSIKTTTNIFRPFNDARIVNYLLMVSCT